MLILALVAPLAAAVSMACRFPIDFSRWNLPAVVIGFSSVALLFMGGSFFMPIAVMPLPIYGVAIAVPFATSLLLWRTGPEGGSSLRDVALLVAVAGAYGCGLAYVLNGALTSEPATRLVATVASTRYEGGRHPNYFVRLSSTDPRVGNDEWRVSRAAHWDLATGSQACVDLFRGALGATWYRVGKCPANPAESIPWVGFSGGGLMGPVIRV